MGNMITGTSGPRRLRRRRYRQPPNDDDYGATALPLCPPTVMPLYHPYPGFYPRSSAHDGGCVLHEKAVTIRNDVNINKETLTMEPDLDIPGHFLLAFTLDATAPGCITIVFSAIEAVDGTLIAVKSSLFKQITMPFEKGLCQEFRQPCGTGIELSMLEGKGLTKQGDKEVYPLVVKAEAQPLNRYENDRNQSSKEKGGYKVQVMKQVLWVSGTRYELQEVYSIGNASDDGIDGFESGGECAICLSETRDTLVLPCRHLCMCGDCANLLKAHTAKCPICRHPVERLLEIKVNNGSGEH